jgi:hypothetical protein
MITRFFRLWPSGYIGVGPMTTVFWRPGGGRGFPGCKALRESVKVHERTRALALQVGEALTLSDGSVLERVR